MTTDEIYIRRCFQLAQLGAGHVSPNPMVGAVLVHDRQIIGEGWHRQYGAAHAEVNCIAAVLPEHRHRIREATLYCSLEPCFHIGKTPPCVDLILAEKIPKVVVSNTDPNPKVAGQSFDKLRAAGVTVVSGVLEAEGAFLNRAFFTSITQKRPYIILKWAQSRDGFIGRVGERTAVSGVAARRLVHRWRSEVDAILVGTNTAITDNPRLDIRYYFGRAPLRVALDRMGKIPDAHYLLDDSQLTRVVGVPRPGAFQQTEFVENTATEMGLSDILEQLQAEGRTILLVEGGAQTLETFLAAGYWDEIRVLENPQYLGAGIPAPKLPATAVLKTTASITEDTIQFWVSGV